MLATSIGKFWEQYPALLLSTTITGEKQLTLSGIKYPHHPYRRAGRLVVKSLLATKWQIDSNQQLELTELTTGRVADGRLEIDQFSANLSGGKIQGVIQLTQDKIGILLDLILLRTT
ncbi:MAG: hypothetical protein U5M53_01585 [Rhodoferax sp.]|nr:hypothetical protein [Rhodoferax sp.]